MLDIFAKVLKSVVSQMGAPAGDQLSKIEKDLARKFDALEEHARRQGRNRWLFLLLVCALVALAGFLSFRQMGRETRQMVQERMDKEFSSVVIQKTIEDSAKKYAELHLKEYVDTQIASQYRVAKLESMARLDSRRAYEELVALSADPKFREDAEFSLSVIRKRYEPLQVPFEAQGTIEQNEATTVQLKLDPLKASEPQIDALRPRLHQLARESEKNYLVPDFIRFLKESDSLGASVGICRILAHNYGPKAGDYDFDKWIQILETLDKEAVHLK